MKTEQIGTLEAKTRFSDLVRQVEQGSTFVITRHGRPIARLLPMERTRRRKAGFGKNWFSNVSGDFDAPLDEFAEYR